MSSFRPKTTVSTGAGHYLQLCSFELVLIFAMTPVNGGIPAMQPRSSKKRKQENSEMDDALTAMIRENAKSR